MATITLLEASKLGLNDLAAGVAEEVVTADQFFRHLPFNTVFGNAYTYNREGTPGNVASLAIGAATSSVKTQATYSQVSVPLTSIIGDAEVNDLLIAQGVGGNAGNDLVAQVIASKAKQVGREYSRQIAVGNASAPGQSVSGDTNGQEFDGIATVLATAAFSSQVKDLAGEELTAEDLDELIDAIHVGRADFIVANSAAIRKIRAILRASGGVTMEEVGGYQYQTYNGIPFYRNDYFPVTAGTGGDPDTANIYAGAWDDGSRQYGLAGIMAANGYGLNVVPVGEAENGDYGIWRVKMYGSFAIHSTKSVAVLKNVKV